MKFIHVADIHFDIPFSTLRKKGLSEQRRLEQREIFRKMITYAKENKIESLFLCGDIYEHEYVRQTTIEYMNELFRQIPETTIYIVPGNHDPKIKNSYYSKFQWSSNVIIFQDKIQKIDTREANIYGYGFTNFYRKDSTFEIPDLNNEKINILLTHASLNASAEEEKQYNPIQQKELEKIGFDYIALGHIHKPILETTANIVYPGSMLSLGFDEPGKHGMVVGEITKEKKVILDFIPLDTKEFCKKEMQISNILSQEELIEKINQISWEPNQYIELILMGKKNFEISITELEKYIKNSNILKIKNNTQYEEELEILAKKPTLKGIFVKNMLHKLQEEGNNEKIKRALEIGLEAMK